MIDFAAENVDFVVDGSAGRGRVIVAPRIFGGLIKVTKLGKEKSLARRISVRHSLVSSSQT